MITSLVLVGCGIALRVLFKRRHEVCSHGVRLEEFCIGCCDEVLRP